MKAVDEGVVRASEDGLPRPHGDALGSVGSAAGADVFLQAQHGWQSLPWPAATPCRCLLPYEDRIGIAGHP